MFGAIHDTWTVDVEKTYSAGYGLSLKVYDAATKAFKPGVSVAATLETTRRGAPAVVFTTSVSATSEVVASVVRSTALAMGGGNLTHAIANAGNVLNTGLRCPHIGPDPDLDLDLDPDPDPYRSRFASSAGHRHAHPKCDDAGLC